MELLKKEKMRLWSKKVSDSGDFGKKQTQRKIDVAKFQC